MNSADSTLDAGQQTGQITAQVNSEGKVSAQHIQQEIIHRICFLDYLPGRQLKESELADEFGVSRTPVRDAISRIKHLGLVETRNGVGTVVVALDQGQIADVYEMRLKLATMIGEMGSRSDSAVCETSAQKIEQLLEGAILLQDNFVPRRYVELNHQLQAIIADLIDNSLLASYWRQTYYQAASTWYQISQKAQQETTVAFIQELQELLTALQRRDLQAVGLVQRVHIGYGYQRIQAHIFCK